jgi:hypothetical protein
MKITEENLHTLRYGDKVTLEGRIVSFPTIKSLGQYPFKMKLRDKLCSIDFGDNTHHIWVHARHLIGNEAILPPWKVGDRFARAASFNRTGKVVGTIPEMPDCLVVTMDQGGVTHIMNIRDMVRI